jgi:haloalkane dehalogenase
VQNQQKGLIEEYRSQVSQMLDSLEPGTPIAAIVLFKVARAKEQAFLKNASVLTEATRRLPGCNVFSFHQAVQSGSAAEAIEYLIYEDWETRDLFRTQWNSQHLKYFRSTVGDQVVDRPDLRLYIGWNEYRYQSSTGTAESSGTSPPPAESDDVYSSMLRFSWTMSLFGAQQMANLAVPSRVAQALSNVSHATEAQLGDTMKAALRAGDSFQKSFIHAARGAFTAERGAPPQQSPPDPPRPPPSAPRQSGWGPMPSAAPPAGPSPSPAPAPMGEPDISPDFPFAPHYVAVLGSRMHYIKQGSGDTILLLHGNPSWSYCWRNIIPHLSPLGQCIAPDLIGFGKSDKPTIEYHWMEHAKYLEAFIETMGLQNITLILHDQGSALGLHYAMRHEKNVKAIAFFEALVRPFTWENFSTPPFRERFRQFRTGGIGGEGWQLLVDQNMFIEQLLPQASGRPLSEKEMNYYREPFRDPSSRVPIWRFARETAIGGEPKDVWDAVTEYSAKLQKSKHPKLMLYATPGALLTQEHVAWCEQSIGNLESVNIGPGLHFLEESSPHRIGRETAEWYRSLPRSRG